MHHPIAGDLELTGEALQLPGDPELTIITYTFDPASPTEQALTFLASWTPRENHHGRGGPTDTSEPTQAIGVITWSTED